MVLRESLTKKTRASLNLAHLHRPQPFLSSEVPEKGMELQCQCSTCITIHVTCSSNLLVFWSCLKEASNKLLLRTHGTFSHRFALFNRFEVGDCLRFVLGHNMLRQMTSIAELEYLFVTPACHMLKNVITMHS